MEKYIYDNSNGLWYELHGEYYLPCLVIPEEEVHTIGIWGRKHQQYLREYRPIIYSDLVLSGKLYGYLSDIDTQARNKLDLLVTQLAEKEGINESLDRSHGQHPRPCGGIHQRRIDFRII